MSLVTEVLTSAVKAQVVNINQKIIDIVRKIDENKTDVVRHVDCIKYAERPRSNQNLLNKTIQLVDEANKLENDIEEILKTDITDVKSKVALYKNQLGEITSKLKVSSYLIHTHEILLKIGKLCLMKEYMNAMNEFNKICEYINPVCDESYLDIFDELRTSIVMEQWSLVKKLTNIFNENVQCCEDMPYVLKVKKVNDEFLQVLQALASYKSSITPLDTITRFLWDCVFFPIINHKTKIEQQEDGFYIISVTVTNTKEKDTYKKVFDNIISVLEFLNKCFNHPLKENLTTLSYIGNDLRDNLSELIIKNCLNDTIPSTSDDLSKYTTVISHTEDLQNKLIECQIFSKDSCSIVEHVKNVDVLFINKKCQEYLLAATSIVKKDLHDMVEVGIKHDVNTILTENITFEQCYVSRSCIELLELAEKILLESITSSDECGSRLYCTVQNIFQIYGNLVQEHHQKLLQTIPQQVALFHNNCMYISYTLTQWNETYKGKLTEMTNSEPPTFKDNGYFLRSIGNKAFIDCLQQQINQVEEIMNDSGIVNVSILEKLEPITEKCIRQCLRQQELLKTVWQKVLSYSEYNRTIGSILSFLCNYIINSIVNIKDISSVAAEQLTDILKVILVRGPKLFSDPKEIYLYVQQWHRMNELVFILVSNLMDINDRWSDGKGPLALHFKPEELKQLIQALFQDTERRAALLRKIS